MKKVILLLACILTFGLVLSGCGNKINTDFENIEGFVSEFLDMYRQKNEDAGDYLYNVGDDYNITYNGMQEILAEKIEYKFGTIAETETGYEVETKIKNVDFKKIFENVIENVTEDMSSEEITTKLYSEISKDNAPKREFDINILIINDTDNNKRIILMS